MHDDKFTKGKRGEFRGDFTRDTFDPTRHFTRVLMQQGRVQLDADWNEQGSIFSYFLRRLAADLIGPHGAPHDEDGNEGKGFMIEADGKSFKISKGHYYVNGILCENCDCLIENDEHNCKENDYHTYSNQPDYPLTDEEKILAAGNHLVYLDVWERHLSYVEDDYMREKALGGPETATRARIVWQVKVKKNVQINKNTTYDNFLKKLADEKKPGSGRLKARARKMSEDTTDPCLTLPEAKYRGAENQLYRVEIHRPGSVQSNDEAQDNEAPTFKWSRENGSVIFPIKKIEDKTVTLEHLGRDDRYGLKPNDWVEIVDDDYIFRNRADAMLQIEEVDHENIQVTLKEKPVSLVGTEEDKHPYLRRWDQKDGDSTGVHVQESEWILLEEGVQIQFSAPGSDNKGKACIYQNGDYWLIPARTSTGDVEWPGSEDNPDYLPPQGVEHYYAPLGKIKVDKHGTVSVPDGEDLRRKLKKNWA